MIVLEGLADRVEALAFAPDGAGLATASARFGVGQVWPDIRAGPGPAVTFPIPEPIHVRFLPDGRIVIEGYGPVRLFDPQTGGSAVLALDPPAGWMRHLTAAPDADRFVAYQHDIARPHTRNRLCGRTLADPDTSVWTADTAAVGGLCGLSADWFVTAEIAGGAWRLAVRRFADGKCVRAFDRDGTGMRLLAAVPGRPVLVGAVGPDLAVHNLSDGSGEARIVRGASAKHVTGLAVHPAGGVVAAVCKEGTVTVFSTETWRPVRAYDWRLGRLLSVAFSPDGTLAAVGTDRGRAVVWDFDF